MPFLPDTSVWIFLLKDQVRPLDARKESPRGGAAEVVSRADDRSLLVFREPMPYPRIHTVRVLPQWNAKDLPIHVVYAGQRLLLTRVSTFIDFAISYMTKELASHAWKHFLQRHWRNQRTSPPSWEEMEKVEASD